MRVLRHNRSVLPSCQKLCTSTTIVVAGNTQHSNGDPTTQRNTCNLPLHQEQHLIPGHCAEIHSWYRSAVCTWKEICTFRLNVSDTGTETSFHSLKKKTYQGQRSWHLARAAEVGLVFAPWQPCPLAWNVNGFFSQTTTPVFNLHDISLSCCCLAVTAKGSMTVRPIRWEVHLSRQSS